MFYFIGEKSKCFVFMLLWRCHFYLQSKDLAASLDRKIDDSQKSSDERASRIEEALKNTKDDLLAKISQATADLEDKTKREIEATRDEVTKDLSQKVSRSIIGLVNLVLITVKFRLWEF